MLSLKHVQNDLCTFLRAVFGQCVDLKKIRAETTSKYFLEQISFYIYEIYREFFDVFRILLTKELQCRHQSLSTDKTAGNFRIYLYALYQIKKTTTTHITYLFKTKQTA